MEIYLNDTKYIINTPISSHPCWLCGAEQALKKVIKKFGVINEVFWKLPEKVIKKCMFHIFKYETSKIQKFLATSLFVADSSAHCLFCFISEISICKTYPY